MEKNEVKDTGTVRSYEVNEILGQAPNWVIRWGISVILIIVILLVTGAALISYDDIIPARITITTSNPPAYIKARSSGKISEIFVKADQPVEEGELLAMIENPANYVDVYWAKSMIYAFEPKLSDLDSLTTKFPLTLSLGESQFSYYSFITQYQNYLLYKKNDPNQVQVNLLAEQIDEQQKLLQKQQNQLDLFEKELGLSSKAFDRNKSLYDSSVISQAEFENRSRAFLNDQQRYESLKIQMANTEINISRLNGDKVRAGLSDEEAYYNNRQYLEEGIQNLKNAINSWEQRFAIVSPTAGRVTLFDIWNKYQNAEIGTVLFTVVPNDTSSLIGHVVMPVQNSGKVSVGQEVIIKIDNYPHPEWGSLRGRITNISSVPKQGLSEYAIQVEIDGLITSFNKTLEFKQEMQGSAEIVTEKLTVLQRIFYQLRQVLQRK